MPSRHAMTTLLTAAAVAAGTFLPVWAASAAAAPAGRAGGGGPAAAGLTGSAFAPGSGQSVVDWNKTLITITGTPGAQPKTVHPTRSFAILQAAEYDATVSVTHVGRPYLFRVPVRRPARADAAADQAAHDVLAALYPSMTAVVDSQLAAELAGMPASRAKQRGIEAGRAVAQRLLAIRAGDGSAVTPPPFTPGTAPGDYQPTPPNFAAPVFTNWGAVTPFLLRSGSQFRPAAPPPVTSEDYAEALAVVQSLGRDTSTTRTADQTAAGKFWGAAPLWNVWNEVAQAQTLARHASLQRAATVFAALDLTFADTAIGLYDAKYHFQVWRPVTAIRMGATTGNPGIVPDPSWTPLTPTAPDPSYPGAHSGFSEAAATVLTIFFGNQPVTVRSDALPGQTRSFTSFHAAAEEAALSRIWAGQHTPLDDQAGRTLGTQIAAFDLLRLLG